VLVDAAEASGCIRQGAAVCHPAARKGLVQLHKVLRIAELSSTVFTVLASQIAIQGLRDMRYSAGDV